MAATVETLIHDLATVSPTLASWARGRIAAGSTLNEVKDKIRGAMEVAETRRAST